MGDYTEDKIKESFQGWQEYVKWANTYRLRKNIPVDLIGLIAQKCTQT